MVKKIEHLKKLWDLETDDDAITALRDKVTKKISSMKYIYESDIEDLVEECVINILYTLNLDNDIEKTIDDTIDKVYKYYVKHFRMRERIDDIFETNKEIFDEFSKITDVLDMPERIHIVATRLHIEDSSVLQLINNILNF